MKISIDSPVLIIIQSRLSSTRLPAKALLPIAGYPSVVLCALRAENSSHSVLVATSDEEPDDLIVNVLDLNGIQFFRGSHNNVLSRFTKATESFPEHTLIVRLTADNVFPDGSFIDELLEQFLGAGVDYLGTNSPNDGLPYGMSAEVFTLNCLRQADKNAISKHDREHVTPWIKTNCKVAQFSYSNAGLDWVRYRCTLDNYDDYLRLARVSKEIYDPVNVSWQDLVAQLKKTSYDQGALYAPALQMQDGIMHSRLTLGTVQLGLEYGVANATGLPNSAQIISLLQSASSHGVSCFDTARAYGKSEEEIGNFLSSGYQNQVRVVTKLGLLNELTDSSSEASVISAVNASFFQSCHSLGLKKIDTFLLHRWDHYVGWGGAVWKRLLELKNSGLIRVLGVSVSNPNEAIEALQDSEIGHLQCPVNLLDWRWKSEDFITAVSARPDVVIHARSVLLQGLLTLDTKDWFSMPELDTNKVCNFLDKMVVDLERENRIDLCIAYVLSLPWVTSLVIGVETLEQLQTNLGYMNKPLSIDELKMIEENCPLVPEQFLNPANWKAYQ